MRHERCIVPAAVVAVAIVACPNASGAEVADETVSAIWRIQQVSFVYRSSTVYYSCRGLQEKISAILRAVGAHTRVLVDVGCMGPGFINSAFAEVTLAAPVEATQESVRAATTFGPRERLIARVRKTRLPTPEDIQRFPAEWQTVSLSRRGGLRLGPGDCDLLRAMHRQVFPKLSIRIDDSRLRCTSGVATRLRPNLEITALLPAPVRTADADAG